MLRTEAMEEYGKAQKLGQKDYREEDAPRAVPVFAGAG